MLFLASEKGWMVKIIPHEISNFTQRLTETRTDTNTDTHTCEHRNIKIFKLNKISTKQIQYK